GSLLTFAIKDSAVASVIAVPELMRQSQIVAGQTYHFKEVYTAAMIVYFLLCYPVARGVDRVYRRGAPLGAAWRFPRGGGGGVALASSRGPPPPTSPPLSPLVVQSPAGWRL